MDPSQRQHICDDLRGIVKGELLFDELSCALYSTDASIFQVQPLGVVTPRDEEEVQALVRYAAEHQLPLIPRGAGSGLAGESLGSGLIVDMSRHFRAILEIGSDTVRVQPGVVHRDLNDVLARIGRRFAPDPASAAQCTIGGMLATNASGARAIRNGYTRDHVTELRVVLDTGEATVAGRSPRWPAPDAKPGRREDIVASVITLLEQNTQLIRQSQPRTRFNRCGYLLHDVLAVNHLDLAKLLIGSEGTLALFTEATLRTVPLPVGRSLVLLGFTNLDAACQAAQRSLSGGPAACELIDRRLLTLIRGNDAEFASLVPVAIEAALLIEYEADSAAGAQEAARQIVDLLYRTEHLAVHALIALESAEIDRFWSLREVALPSLYGLRGGAQPIPFIEDVGVPPEELLRYLHGVQDILQRHETTASFLVHAAAGQVHTRPFLDLQRPEDVAKLWAIADEVCNLVLDLGGTISSQHGTGLARTPWVARQYGKLYPVLRELKAIFDPRHLFNPGKIVGPDPDAPAWPLRLDGQGDKETGRQGDRETERIEDRGSRIEDRTGAVPSSILHPPSSILDAPGLPVSLSQLRWQPGEMRTESLSCNGCGHCRTAAPRERMCPIFRAQHAEAAAPRAKANLVRHLLQEGANGKALSSDEVRAVADLCVNCKMCASECPAHVNIPKLMLEAKAANAAEHGLSRSDWVMARVENFSRIGSAVALLANAALSSRTARWLMERMFGVSRRRRLPVFALRSFIRRAERHGWTRPPRTQRPRIAYFVDIFANYNAPQIAEAVVAVLKHNGFEVYVPPDQLGCGMAPLAYGDVDTARETVEHNLRILADLVREGYTVLCSEPTAALMLRRDVLDLLDDPDAKLVADHVVEFTAFLWDLHTQGRLQTDFRPLDISIGHHVPCHLKALGRPPAGPALLALIPSVRVHTIDVSCSGMAGTFGLKAENYELSLEAGRPMLEELSHPRILFGSTECSPCRIQMENWARKRTLHPAEYLALAYGLMPETARRLNRPVRGLAL